MFAGHFGLAAAVKGNSNVPLWVLMLSTQLLDVIFVPLYVLGIETIQPLGSGGYGEQIIHADYTHSLVGALLISILAGWLASLRWRRQGGFWVAAVVFSHWLLDLLVHRADLAILPGDAADLPRLGLGLWAVPGLSMALELALIILGVALYTRSVLARGHTSGRPFTARGIAFVMATLLVASLVSNVLGLG